MMLLGICSVLISTYCNLGFPNPRPSQFFCPVFPRAKIQSFETKFTQFRQMQARCVSQNKNNGVVPYHKYINQKTHIFVMGNAIRMKTTWRNGLLWFEWAIYRELSFAKQKFIVAYCFVEHIVKCIKVKNGMVTLDSCTNLHLHYIYEIREAISSHRKNASKMTKWHGLTYWGLAKLSPFHRSHFQMHFLERNCVNFASDFTEVCSLFQHWFL